MDRPELHHVALDHELALLKAEERIGIDVGFIRRRPRKIEPLQLLKAFCMLLPGSCPSLRALATVLSVLCSEAVSKQAVAKRIGRPWVEFLKQMLALLLCRRLDLRPVEALFAPFKRVLLHDSSVLPLPSVMAPYYKGSRDRTGRAYAQAKVQAILDIKNRSYLHCAVTDFTCNDQRAAADVLKLVGPGDLVIRDLGYFVLGILARIADAGAFFVSRYRHGCLLFDPNGLPVDLVEILNKEGQLDRRVCIGKAERLPVRIVAVPLPPSLAQKRRRLLRQNRDHRLNPGKRHLRLLGWAIFVTNVTEDIWSACEIREIYRLRWRIEIVFKAWKSHFGINAYSRTASRYQTESLLYTRLIYILLFQRLLYNPLLYEIDRRHERKLSILKCASFFTQYHWLIPLMTQSSNRHLLIDILGRLCTYDKRKRLNYEEMLENYVKQNHED
jgi:hypothetical protein